MKISHGGRSKSFCSRGKVKILFEIFVCGVGQKIRTGEGQNRFPHGGRSKSFSEKSDMIHCVFFVMGYQGPDKVRRDLKIQVDWRQKFRTGSRGRSKSFLEKSDMMHCVCMGDRSQVLLLPGPDKVRQDETGQFFFSRVGRYTSERPEDPNRLEWKFSHRGRPKSTCCKR